MWIRKEFYPLLLTFPFSQYTVAVPLGPTTNSLLSLSTNDSSVSWLPSYNLTDVQPANVNAISVRKKLTALKWKIGITDATWAIEAKAPKAILYEVRSYMRPNFLQRLPTPPSELCIFTVKCYDPQGEGASKLISVNGTLDPDSSQIRWTEPERSIWPQRYWVPTVLFWPPNHDIFDAYARISEQRPWSGVSYQHFGGGFSTKPKQVYESFGAWTSPPFAIFEAETLQKV